METELALGKKTSARHIWTCYLIQAGGSPDSTRIQATAHNSLLAIRDIATKCIAREVFTSTPHHSSVTIRRAPNAAHYSNEYILRLKFKYTMVQFIFTMLQVFMAWTKDEFICHQQKSNC